MNESTTIRILESKPSLVNRDRQDSDNVTRVIRQHILATAPVEYSSVQVKVHRNPDGSPHHLVAYSLRKDTYTADVKKILVDGDFNVLDVEHDYIEPEDEDDQPPRQATVSLEDCDFLVGTPCSDYPTAVHAVQRIYEAAVHAGYRAQKLIGDEATIANYQRALTSHLRAFVNIGHGSESFISLWDGPLKHQWFDRLSSSALTPCVVYFNSCNVFNPPLKPAVMNAGARTYIGGELPLRVGPSEAVTTCFWTKSIQSRAPMGVALETCIEEQHYPEPNAWGICGDVGPFKADTERTIDLSDIPRGSFLTWDMATGAANRVKVRLEDDVQAYADNSAQGVPRKVLSEGYSKVEGNKLRLHIAVDNASALTVREMPYQLANTQGEVVIMGRNIFVEDSTDGDFNDLAIMMYASVNNV